jgi:hypothetical protein
MQICGHDALAITFTSSSCYDRYHITVPYQIFTYMEHMLMILLLWLILAASYKIDRSIKIDLAIVGSITC